MIYRVDKKQCPRCHSMDVERIRRKWWMRMIPKTKAYQCDDCGCEFLLIYGNFAFKYKS